MNIAQKEKRISRFYGDVAREQNGDIIRLVTGRRVLDVGCGYGNLIAQIRKEKKGVEVIGIDVDPESIKTAKDLYGIEVRQMSACNLEFPDDFFDTVILRETIHHIAAEDSFGSALKEIRRVCKKELIVFDPNPNWVLRVSRKIIRHVDPEAPIDGIIKALEANGFNVRECRLRDVIAFPLSGGFVGKELVPNIGPLKRVVINLDRHLNNVMRKLRLQKHFCWRYLIYATK